MELLYTSKEVSELLSISKRTVSRRCSILKLGHTGRKFRFDETDFNLIKNYKRINATKPIKNTSSKVFKYYPVKTIETFYIYESKLNTIEL